MRSCTYYCQRDFRKLVHNGSYVALGQDVGTDVNIITVVNVVTGLGRLNVNDSSFDYDGVITAYMAIRQCILGNRG